MSFRRSFVFGLAACAVVAALLATFWLIRQGQPEWRSPMTAAVHLTTLGGELRLVGNLKLTPHDLQSLRVDLDLSCANQGAQEAAVPGDWQTFSVDVVGGVQSVSECRGGKVAPRGTLALECRPVEVALDNVETEKDVRYYFSRPMTVRAGGKVILYADTTIWNVQ